MRRKIITNKQKSKFNFDLKKIKIYVLGALCGVLAISCIFMTIETATSGSEVASLQNKESQLLAKQQDLQEQLVESLSVNSLQEQSTSLGFTKVSNLVYVTDSVPVAAKLP